MIIMTGIPGAGKSSIFEQLKIKLPDWKIVNWGDMTFEVAKSLGKAETRADIELYKKITQSEMRMLQKEVASEIAKMPKKTIVDTHSAIKTQHGWLPGLPLFALSEMPDVNRLVLVDAPLEQIINRRAQDPKRSRDLPTIDELRKEEDIVRAYLIAASVVTGAPMKVIMNCDGKLNEAVDSFLKLVE